MAISNLLFLGHGRYTEKEKLNVLPRSPTLSYPNGGSVSTAMKYRSVDRYRRQPIP